MEASDILGVTYVWEKSDPPFPQDHREVLKVGDLVLRDGELYVAKPSVNWCDDACAHRECWAYSNKPFWCDGMILVKL